MFCPMCGKKNIEEASFCQHCGKSIPILDTEEKPSSSPTSATPVSGLAVPQTKYAGFWLRFLAYLIDSMVIGVGLSVLYFALNLHSEMPVPGQGFVFVLLSWAFIWAYHAQMESSKYQATLGKIVVGIIVTDLNGDRISFGKATGRFWGKLVSGLILGIGYLMAGFTKSKQALHDELTGCLVVRKGAQG